MTLPTSFPGELINGPVFPQGSGGCVCCCRSVDGGGGAGVDLVRGVGIGFAEPLWDRTATGCRSRLYCLVKSAGRKERKYVR